MSEPQQTKIIPIDRRYNTSERQRIAEDIVEYIKRRTRLGVSASNAPFPPYSPNYNKPGKGTVNLTLTGDMLDGLKVLSTGVGFIKIGFKPRSNENNKASYNQRTGPGPDRIFLDIMPADLSRILQNYPIPAERRFPGLVDIGIAAATIASINGDSE